MKKNWKWVFYPLVIILFVVLFLTGDYSARFWIGQLVIAVILLLIFWFMKHWGSKLE